MYRQAKIHFVYCLFFLVLVLVHNWCDTIHKSYSVAAEYLFKDLLMKINSTVLMGLISASQIHVCTYIQKNQ